MGRERHDEVRRRRLRVRSPAGRPQLIVAAIALASAWWLAGSSAPSAAALEPRNADFAIRFNGETSAYREFSAFVLPGAALDLEAIGGPPGDYTAKASSGELRPRGPKAWQWRAPTVPGSYEVKIDGPETGKDTIALNTFVMVPAGNARGGVLNGYMIGQYPSKPLKGNPIYRPPSGFIEVTKETEDKRVSPHFRLKQFVCKEDTSKKYPKYVVLQERLLLKLEAILERVNALGYHVDTLHVMSGYRTPFYNRAIGDVPYSMHQWGSAADVFIDKDDKGVMDDLNHDGQVDVDDSKLLYDAIETMLGEPEYARLQGGMGFYPGTRAHPPFVHVDVRGTKARWKG